MFIYTNSLVLPGITHLEDLAGFSTVSLKCPRAGWVESCKNSMNFSVQSVVASPHSLQSSSSSNLFFLYFSTCMKEERTMKHVKKK